jgi:uncharacterized membrane protein
MGVGKRIVLALLVVLFLSSGVAHFLRPAPFVAIMPPYLPSPRVLVLVSGAFEILGGVGLLIPAIRRWAGVGLVALLLAVYPANIYMATNDIPIDGWHVPWWGHAIRLPLQFVLIWLVWWVSQPRRPSRQAAPLPTGPV